MASAVDTATSLVSAERDAVRASACKDLFAPCPNVTILHGDWREIVPHGPFDLLVLDGGGGAKRAGGPPAEPAELLKPGGTVVLDDFHPPLTEWPAPAGTLDEFGRDLNHSRAHWFGHPDLLTTELRVHPEASALVGIYCGRGGER